MKPTTKLRAIRELEKKYRETITNLEYLGMNPAYRRERERLIRRKAMIARILLGLRQYEFRFPTR